MQSKKAIIIAGPTAVGKTEVAYSVAQKLDCEIISADARQIYRGMVIGTAAPIDPPVKHHLVGVLEPSERCTAAWWAEKAADIMENLRSEGKTSLIVGGTGLYIRTLVEGIFPGPGEDSELRAELQQRIEAGENLHDELVKLDPAAAEKIHPNNTIRIIRALEVCYLTGKPLSKLFERTASIAKDWQFLKFFLIRPRKTLYQRIDERTRRLLETGWIEETKALLNSGVSSFAPGMEAIGYREIVRYLDGELDREELFDTIARKTRRYAKRQLTWFRHRPGFEELDIEELGMEGTADHIVSASKKD